MEPTVETPDAKAEPEVPEAWNRACSPSPLPHAPPSRCLRTNCERIRKERNKVMKINGEEREKLVEMCEAQSSVFPLSFHVLLSMPLTVCKGEAEANMRAEADNKKKSGAGMGRRRPSPRPGDVVEAGSRHGRWESESERNENGRSGVAVEESGTWRSRGRNWGRSGLPRQSWTSRQSGAILQRCGAGNRNPCFLTECRNDGAWKTYAPSSSSPSHGLCPPLPRLGQNRESSRG